MSVVASRRTLLSVVVVAIIVESEVAQAVMPPGWQGPCTLIWNNDQCQLLTTPSSATTTPEACATACTATAECTAINWNRDTAGTGSRCQLRGCNASAAPAPTWSVPDWVGYSTFPLPPSPPPPPPSGLLKVELTKAAATDGAVCLDGSPPVYYFRAGAGSGSRSYILFLEGGGWCAGIGTPVGGFDSCLARSITGLGSSLGYGPTMSGSGEAGALFSTDPTVNPRFHNWNVAYAKYCDGGSFSGNRCRVKNPPQPPAASLCGAFPPSSALIHYDHWDTCIYNTSKYVCKESASVPFFFLIFGLSYQ
eukprot:m.166862 g.166862  ORF g.166862 m.166862 type:complete len:307 (-) comp24068_c0_seq1:1151-2071(-)